MTASADLRATFGEIDIYLFDQLVRGRFDNRASLILARASQEYSFRSSSPRLYEAM